ncbi:uncharacterized protein VTP21DRAFT_9415 [Calcarisporiella thermophila]|uniref:uncharacterized protein n=1 Tax=Calcarisporiella thermophila TaxID=911321 RepID=UPI003742A440
MIGFICVCCPGMFNAINGIGGGGSSDEYISVVARANAGLYAFFAISGYFSGGINNILGPKTTIFLSGWGYVLYVGALLYFQIYKAPAFMIIAGCILGICAALLWSAQGALMMSYPTEQTKGRYISVFWAIFNAGAAASSAVVLGLNASQNKSGTVSISTYVAILIAMSLGLLVTALLVSPNYVRRKDGSRVVVLKYPPVRQELIATARLIFDKKIILLIPLCFYSNFFYAYQFRANGAYFSVRARGLNNLVYWLAQILGALLFGLFLDSGRYVRRTRAYFGLAIVLVLFSATWAAGLFIWQLTFTKDQPSPNVDWTDPRFIAPCIVYIFYGLCDAMYQVYCYWLMGAITNDPLKLSRYAGFYKGVQSAGSAVSWYLDSVDSFPFLAEILLNWGLLLFSVPFAFLIARQIRDTNYTLDDIAVASSKPSPSDFNQKLEQHTMHIRKPHTHIDEGSHPRTLSSNINTSPYNQFEDLPYDGRQPYGAAKQYPFHPNSHRGNAYGDNW